MFYRSIALFLLIMSAIAQAQTDNGSNEEQQNVEGETRYISDDLYTFLHAGPGRNFRILGSVTAGTTIKQLQIDNESQYIEIVDDKDRRGWVDANFVVDAQSIRSQLAELQENLSAADQNLDQQDQALNNLNRQLIDLQAQNTTLKQQNEQLEAQQDGLQQRLSTQDKSEQQQWFIRGGGIAIVGVVLGIIIAYLPKKRRRNDAWM
jgi:SH3 domain protein